MGWTLRRKIIIGYSIVLILMIIVFVWSLVNLLGLGRGILKGNYMSMICADNMSAAIEQQNDAMSLIILGYVNEGSEQFEDNRKLFLQWLAQEKNYITEIGESDTVKDIEMKYSLYMTQFSMFRTLYQIDSPKSTKFYHETMLPSFQSVRASITRLREINQNALFKITDQAQFITTRAIWIMTVIGIIATGIGLGLSLLLSNLFVKQRIEHELAAATKIQTHLIPQEVPQSPTYKIAARNIPSEAVSGDFYDFIPIDDSHLGIVIADVSGKGIPAAILMASARASLRAYLEDPHTVAETITRLNRVLCRDISVEQFVTLFYGTLDTQNGTFTYTNAGHDPPILLRNNEMISLDKGGTVLGVLPDAYYREEDIQLMEGDLLILYTDGITGAERGDECFGKERLSAIVQNNSSKNPEDILKNVFSEVAKFNGSSSQNDDMTIVVLCYSGNPNRHLNNEYSEYMEMSAPRKNIRSKVDEV